MSSDALSPQGSLVDGRVIDTSLARDPLVIELGQKQVIPGMWPVPPTHPNLSAFFTLSVPKLP